MTEDESIFDPMLKKKKKKKKLPFDFSTLEENSQFDVGGSEQTEDAGDDATREGENETIDEKDDKDTVLDLDDFSGLKKKKKKKKPFSVEDTESNTPESNSKDDVSVVITDEKDFDGLIENDELDFTLPKKKKKKKKINIDELESEVVALDDDDEDDTKFEDDAEPKLSTAVSSSSWLGTDRDYSYEELLIRVFNIMREKNPDMVAGEKRRFIMRPPQVLRVGTKKTSFANFIEICKMVHRQPRHMQAFILAELGTSGSVDANNQLIIKGRFQQKQIENVLRRYIKEYVTCHTCRSPDTILQKDTRLFFLQCETCGSRCSVASIKSGFQAVTGKRAAIRAKTA
jgi:translation initiation factor 2 subunit 2